MANSTATAEIGAYNVSLAGKFVTLAHPTFSALSMSLILPVLPAITDFFKDVPNAAALTRLMATITGFMVMFCAPLMGALMDRLGGRRLVIIAVTIFGLAGFAGFFLENIYALLATRVFVGWGLATVGNLMLVFVVRNSTGNASNRWFGYIGMVSVFASVIIMPLGGFLGHYGWHWPFAMYLAVLPLAFFTYIGFPPDPPYVAPVKSDTADAPSRGRPALGFLFFCLICGIVLTSPYLYVPFHLRDVGVSDPKQIGMVLIPCSIVGGVVGFFYGALRTRLSISGAFIIVFGFAALGVGIVAFSHTFYGVVFGMFVHGIATGVAVGNVYALGAISGPPARRPETLGFAKTGLFGGPIVSQVILEPVIAKYAAQGALLVIVALAVVMTLRECRLFYVEHAAAVPA